MWTHLARIEREHTEYAAENDDEEDDEFDDDDELTRESPAAAAERARQFAIVKELLTAASLALREQAAQAAAGVISTEVLASFAERVTFYVGAEVAGNSISLMG